MNTMNEAKYDFAILVDSCCDVPEDYLAKYPIYVVPMRINYSDVSYRDRIDITPEEIYNKMNVEIPVTSMPTYGDVQEVFEKIRQDGYRKVITINISSNLSGTHNMVRMFLEEKREEGFEIFQFDTKNIGRAAGMYATSVARHLGEGRSYDETVRLLEQEYGNAKVFFVVGTLEYLRKGGRIGKVAGLLGSVLNLKPIITCDEDGTYIVAAKERGSNRSLERAAQLIADFAATSEAVEVSIMQAGDVPAVPQLKERLEELLGIPVRYDGQISPVLGVHTGPGSVGLFVYRK